LPLGTATQVDSLHDLLREADFVSLHVPARPDGRPLIGRNELAAMKDGSYLLNLSRGSLVDLPALKDALEKEKLAGAALDVFPSEPRTNLEDFNCELTGVENVVLTPHLGGSTEEAQVNIGLEVSAAFIRFLKHGSTGGAVNFPQINLSSEISAPRILNIHKNVPGVLGKVNAIVSELGANIVSQNLSTRGKIGYLAMEVSTDKAGELRDRVAALETSIRTRLL